MRYFKLYEELRSAIISRDAEKLRELTKGGRGLLVKGENGNTVIHLTALTLDEDICKVIFQSMNEKLDAKLGKLKKKLLTLDDERLKEAYHQYLEKERKFINFIKIKLRNRFGKSPVHLAVERSNYNFIKCIDSNTYFLLNIKDNFGNLPIHYACKFGNLEIVKEVIFSNSDVKLENLEGNTPLHIAARYGNKKVVEFLLKLGAPLDKENRYGLTPKGVAKFYGHGEIVRMLEEYESGRSL